MAQDLTDKNKKYDRQLRLWGDHGQRALERAKVCLINATATGTEVLKNLVLPGCGSFTIVDGHKMTASDLGNNFFLDKNSIGKSRASVATELILELNEDVNGDYVEEHVEQLLETTASFFLGFNLVIACDISESTLQRLAALLWDAEIPLVICRTCGFFGYLRIVVREHTIIEAHPDSTIEDLRLDRPFAGLKTFCDSIDLNSLTKKEHMHIPWLVLVYKCLQQWKLQHGKSFPANSREKAEIKQLLKLGVRTDEEGYIEDEENFDEAIRNVNTALSVTKVPDEVKKLFEDDSCTNLHAESKPFWIMLRAVKEFVSHEGAGALPLRGTIPDMTADTKCYIGLQNVYREQQEQDIAAVNNNVQQLLTSLGRGEPLGSAYKSPSASPARLQDFVTESDVRLFCKNASFLRVVRCRSLQQELVNPNIASFVAGGGEDSDDDYLQFYLVMRAVDRFVAEYRRCPGFEDHTVDADIPLLKALVTRVSAECGNALLVKDELIHEICRYGGCELHSVAAFMGGVAAQEIIKLLTNQFVPINNTLIYNAIKQLSVTVEL